MGEVYCFTSDTHIHISTCKYIYYTKFPQLHKLVILSVKMPSVKPSLMRMPATPLSGQQPRSLYRLLLQKMQLGWKKFEDFLKVCLQTGY